MAEDNRLIALCGRISRQDEKIKNQELALSAYVDKSGLSEEMFRVYLETGCGAKADRPELLRLIADIKAGQIKKVVVWKLDRLFRSLIDMLNLMELFKEHNVAFESLTEPINTASPTGVLFFQLLACFNQFERSLIIERTRQGLLRARSEGRTLGRPKGSVDKKKQSYRNRSRAAKAVWAEKKEMAPGKRLHFANV